MRIGGLRIGACDFALSRLQTPSIPAFVGRVGICAKTTRRGMHPPRLGSLTGQISGRSWVL
eukprot:14727067-Alexandrium_andersonii.AAC.1